MKNMKIFKISLLGMIGLMSIIFLGGCFSQSYLAYGSTSPEFKGKYAKFLGEGEVEVRSWYHYMVARNASQNYILRVFYPEKKLLTFELTCKDRNGQEKHGPARFWHENGRKKGEGAFKNNLYDGDWKWYHRMNGALSSEGGYLKGEVHGIWKNFDLKGRLKSEYNYVEGEFEGPFTIYDTLGVITNSGIYHSDTLFSETSPDQSPKEQEGDMMPFLSECINITDKKERGDCSAKALLANIYKEIKYPPIARKYGMEGTAVIRFVVTKTGEIKEVEALIGLSDEIKNECLRVINGMPSWEPGIQRGKKVNVYFNLPIKFKLQ